MLTALTNFIAPQFKIWFYALAAIAIFSLGWTINGWRYESQIQTEAAQRLKDIAAAMAEAQKVEAAADKKLAEDNANAKKYVDGLRHCIAHGTCRGGLPTITVKGLSCPNSVGRNNETQRAYLSEAVASDLVAIAADGDEAINQLTACQSILKGMQ